jgi:hypothetical protein
LSSLHHCSAGTGNGFAPELVASDELFVPSDSSTVRPVDSTPTPQPLTTNRHHRTFFMPISSLWPAQAGDGCIALTSRLVPSLQARQGPVLALSRRLGSDTRLGTGAHRRRAGDSVQAAE